MKINPNDPAFPDPIRGGEYGYHNQSPRREPMGLTIRAELAARAMQGLLSASSIRVETGRALEAEDVWHIAKEAVMCADALIAELNKTTQDGK